MYIYIIEQLFLGVFFYIAYRCSPYGTWYVLQHESWVYNKVLHATDLKYIRYITEYIWKNSTSTWMIIDQSILFCATANGTYPMSYEIGLFLC